MSYPKKVVIAVDFQEDNLKTLYQLKNMNLLSNAEVHLVHVVETPYIPMDPIYILYPLPEHQPGFEKAILDKLVKIKNDILPHPHTAHTELKCFFSHDAKERFCEYARGAGADLIVISTRGKKGIPGFFDSSFAQYATKFAPANILTLRPQ